MPERFGWESIDLASIPALQTGEVHIYATALAPDRDWSERAQQVLDGAESERATRFRFEEDRFRFQKTRALLRLLLSAYLRNEAGLIRFREGTHGKPYLQEGESDLQFNVSHTRGAAVLAFARGFELGIDIEHSARKVDIEGVGRRVFTPSERACIERCGAASGLRQFFRYWTAKEAYLKATGSGLSCDPAGIEASFADGQFRSAADPTVVLPYSLCEIPTGNQFLVSMAHESNRPPALRLGEIC